ncbi:MAG: hypothetical protein AAFU79_16160 [Myxococcota bacterium]
MSPHPKPAVLEAVAFGAPEATPEAIAHVDSCRLCQNHVAALRNHRAAFLVQHPPDAFLAKIEPQAPQRRAWVPPVLALAAALGTAAMLVVPRAPVDSAQTKFKGELQLGLRLHLSRDGRPATPFDVRDPLFAGDVIRFVTDLPFAGHVSVGSIDAQGRFSSYLQAPIPEAGPSVVLPGAVRLDAYVGEELIVLAVDAAPVDPATFERRIRAVVEDAGSLRAAHDRGFGPHAVALRILKRQGSP